MRTRACALALLVTLSPAVFPAGAAFADDAMTEMARQRFQEGVKFFDQKKYEEARAAFLQAYALKRHPAVLLNLAQSELRANRHADAARHFAQYLRDNPSASSLEKQDAETGLAEARAKAGRVLVSVNATGADVFVDDELIGKAPLSEPVDVSAGEHRVEARLGDQSAAISVVAPAGRVTEAKLIVGATQAPAIAPTPSPSQPVPGAEQPPPPVEAAPVGEPAPFMGPFDAYSPPPQGDSGLSYSTAGREPFIPWVLHQPIAWATLGVTVVGAGVGIYGMTSANLAASRADDLTIKIQQEWASTPGDQERRPDGKVCGGANPFKKYESACQKLQGALDDESNGKTIAVVGAVTAGVGVVATTVAYLMTSKKSAPPPVAITPVYGPDVAGLSVMGSF